MIVGTNRQLIETNRQLQQNTDSSKYSNDLE